MQGCVFFIKIETLGDVFMLSCSCSYRNPQGGGSCSCVTYRGEKHRGVWDEERGAEGGGGEGGERGM